MEYEEAVALLEDALVFGIDPSLEPIRALCEQLGQPQEHYRCIQVAGTNGKTSTTRMIAAFLRAQGFKTGLYTSPHLVKYPERIEVDGAVVSDERFAQAIEAAYEASRACGIEATEFELLTAAALWLFAEESVDWAVLECGLGGRWDATSVVTPEVAVITGIGLDHTHILGETLEKVAEEKAAIIKPGSKAVLARDIAVPEVFEAQAQRVGAPVTYASELFAASFEDELAKLPGYQRSNCLTAICAVEQALSEPLNPSAARKALESLTIPGRFEVLRAEPLVIVDAAHNPQSARVLAGEIVRCFGSDSRALPTLLLGVLADKDAEGIVDALCPLFSRIVVTASSSPRAIPADELAAIVERRTGCSSQVAHDISEAFALLKDESFIATGSITVAGEIKAFWC